MAKSNNRKKKNPSTAVATATATATTGHSNGSSSSSAAEVPDLALLKRAHELKEEGNRLFQSQDYAAALRQYELALNLTPPSHPDRAVFHSNRAACFLQMRPVDNRAVARECSFALRHHPSFPRALLRRARALEALGSLDLALADAHSLLAVDPTNKDALEIAARLRNSLHLNPNSQNSHNFNSNPDPARPSPAALGASAVGAAPIAGLGPCLPSRAPKKTSPPPPKVVSLKPSKPLAATPPAPPESSQVPAFAHFPSNSINSNGNGAVVNVKMRPLKLVYDHDIRLAQMPVNCRFGMLREIVRKRFPCSKAVLVKYADTDGDLVTITSTEELRMAELYADGKEKEDEKVGLLRLHVVEVGPEQEPLLPNEDEEEEREEQEKQRGNMNFARIQENVVEKSEERMPISPGVSITDCASEDNAKNVVVEEVAKEKVNGHKECNHPECKEVEIDDWLFEFAQLFRTHVGIDPDAHLDLHELGNELCTEALEETVTSEEAQVLFDMAATKFQEVAALAYFNWGNVHMCAARKKIALDESTPKDVVSAQLQSAFDWILEKYTLAGQKYEESLRIKPDFYEGLLALGQQHFETAKLHWSFALANKVDLATWDATGTIGLFNSSEEKMKAATEIWERLEEQRVNEVKDPVTIKREELLKRRRKHGASTDGQPSSNSPLEVPPEEAAEQAAAMRSQIHLFWGNLLFERSQVEFKLGLNGWKKNFDDAVERFKLAGASETDIAVVIKNHSSNEASLEVDEKKVINLINAYGTDAKDEDKHVIGS